MSRRGVLGQVVAGATAAATVAWAWRAARAVDGQFETVGDSLRRPRGHTIDAALAVATDVGSVFGLVGTAAVVAADMSWRAGVDVLGAGSIGWVAGQAAKPLADRPRPWQDGTADLLVHPPMGTSWPSGHTAVSAAVATALTGRGRSTTAVAWGLAAIVGATRVHVGAHHPSDVVAGAGIGILSGLTWQCLRALTTGE